MFATDYAKVDGITQQWSTTLGEFKEDVSVANNVLTGVGPRERAYLRWYVKTVNGCEDYKDFSVINSQYTLPEGYTMIAKCDDRFKTFKPGYFEDVAYSSDNYEWVADINEYTPKDNTVPVSATAPEFYCWVTVVSGSGTYSFDAAKGELTFSQLSNKEDNKFIWHIRSRITGCETTQTWIIKDPTPSPATITSTSASDDAEGGEVCTGIVSLNASPLEVGTGTWEDQGDMSTIAATDPEYTGNPLNAVSIKVTNMSAGAHKFIWRVVNEVGGTSCPHEDEVTIYNNKVDAEILSRATRNTVGCDNIVTLSAREPAAYDTGGIHGVQRQEREDTCQRGAGKW